MKRDLGDGDTGIRHKRRRGDELSGGRLEHDMPARCYIRENEKKKMNWVESAIQF